MCGKDGHRKGHGSGSRLSAARCLHRGVHRVCGKDGHRKGHGSGSRLSAAHCLRGAHACALPRVCGKSELGAERPGRHKAAAWQAAAAARPHLVRPFQTRTWCRRGAAPAWLPPAAQTQTEPARRRWQRPSPPAEVKKERGKDGRGAYFDGRRAEQGWEAPPGELQAPGGRVPPGRGRAGMDQ